jgi:hypothetical protein
MSTEENNLPEEGTEERLAVTPEGTLANISKSSIKATLTPKMQSEARRMAKMQEQIARGGFTVTQVAEVMSHTILEGIETFNKESLKRYEGREHECPQFEVKITPIMFSPEHFRDTGIESRAVFILEMAQFGSKTVVFRTGMDFTCERDRKNVNKWLPGIWQQFFQYMLNTSMFYNVALNPDNPALNTKQ